MPSSAPSATRHLVSSLWLQGRSEFRFVCWLRCECGGMRAPLRWYGSWSECLPKVGGYCPVTCPEDPRLRVWQASACPAHGALCGAQSVEVAGACWRLTPPLPGRRSTRAEGKVACDMVVDYLPNGTSLGYFQPPEQCADSFDKCPCPSPCAHSGLRVQSDAQTRKLAISSCQGGKEAERCNIVGCRPASEGCPITCTAEQKKCCSDEAQKVPLAQGRRYHHRQFFSAVAVGAEATSQISAMLAIASVTGRFVPLDLQRRAHAGTSRHSSSLPPVLLFLPLPRPYRLIQATPRSRPMLLAPAARTPPSALEATFACSPARKP